MKVGDRRPSVLLFDDVEPPEGSGYSIYQKNKRLATILEGAFPGLKVHGARFAADAVAAGAVAILTDEQGARDARASGVPGSVPIVVSPHPRADMGRAADIVYARPSVV